jgi:hypothetical protein
VRMSECGFLARRYALFLDTQLLHPLCLSSSSAPRNIDCIRPGFALYPMRGCRHVHCNERKSYIPSRPCMLQMEAARLGKQWMAQPTIPAHWKGMPRQPSDREIIRRYLRSGVSHVTQWTTVPWGNRRPVGSSRVFPCSGPVRSRQAWFQKKNVPAPRQVSRPDPHT